MDEVVVGLRRSFLLFLTTLFVLLAIMSYQVSDRETGRSVFASVLFRLFSPFHSTASGGYQAVASSIRTYFALAATNHENVRLKKELSELRVRSDMAARLEQENQRLRQILDLRKNLPYRIVVGQVVGRDAKLFYSGTVVVDRGSKQRIKKETPVVAPEGVVGTTILAEPSASKVLLIIDPSASIGAMLKNGRVAGILSGIAGGRCVLRYLPLTTTFKKGDPVITSGQESIFPEGLPIGRVLQEIRENEFYRAVEVTPFVNFSSLSEVMFLVELSDTLPQPAPAPTPAPVVTSKEQ